MPTQHFIEGDLHFYFPVHWGVRKYDQQRFYRHMGGLGLKGVDFLAIDPQEGGQLYFIEVKNYRTRIREGMVFKAPLKEQRKLAKTVVAKYEHTLRAIEGIQVFYQRKWWYRMLYPLLIRSHQWQYDTVFWAHAQQLVRREQTQTLLLWLETEVAAKEYRRQLAAEVREHLPLKVPFVVAERSDSFPKALRVEVDI